jgi:transposase InsO family protein
MHTYFHSLIEVRYLAKEWQLDYNHERPYEVLGFVPPAEYA